MTNNATQRFATRVEHYLKARPGYPPAILDLLRDGCGLTEKSLIADVGSGTGLLSELFLRNGNRTFGVEPNREMREAGEQRLARFPHFTSVEGTAEATTLQAQSVDFVTAGQAFHWFDQGRARLEFARILKAGGWVVLVWNSRREESTPFLQEYEALLQRYATDYVVVNHKQIEAEALRTFFTPGHYTLRTFDNVQLLDLEGLEGRLRSSSYTPEAGHPTFQPMLNLLRSIFDRYQEGGTVAFEYDTEVYYGQLAPTRPASE